MIEVIKRGLPPKDYEYQCSCSNCKSFLKYKASDASIKTSQDQREGSYRSFICPVCSASVSDWSQPINKPSTSHWMDR